MSYDLLLAVSRYDIIKYPSGLIYKVVSHSNPPGNRDTRIIAVTKTMSSVSSLLATPASARAARSVTAKATARESMVRMQRMESGDVYVVEWGEILVSTGTVLQLPRPMFSLLRVRPAAISVAMSPSYEFVCFARCFSRDRVVPVPTTFWSTDIRRPIPPQIAHIPTFSSQSRPYPASHARIAPSFPRAALFPPQDRPPRAPRGHPRRPHGCPSRGGQSPHLQRHQERQRPPPQRPPHRPAPRRQAHPRGKAVTPESRDLATPVPVPVPAPRSRLSPPRGCAGRCFRSSARLSRLRTRFAFPARSRWRRCSRR